MHALVILSAIVVVVGLAAPADATSDASRKSRTQVRRTATSPGRKSATRTATSQSDGGGDSIRDARRSSWTRAIVEGITKQGSFKSATQMLSEALSRQNSMPASEPEKDFDTLVKEAAEKIAKEGLPESWAFLNEDKYSDKIRAEAGAYSLSPLDYLESLAVHIPTEQGKLREDFKKRITITALAKHAAEMIVKRKGQPYGFLAVHPIACKYKKEGHNVVDIAGIVRYVSAHLDPSESALQQKLAGISADIEKQLSAELFAPPSKSRSPPKRPSQRSRRSTRGAGSKRRTTGKKTGER